MKIIMHIGILLLIGQYSKDILFERPILFSIVICPDDQNYTVYGIIPIIRQKDCFLVLIAIYIISQRYRSITLLSVKLTNVGVGS